MYTESNFAIQSVGVIERWIINRSINHGAINRYRHLSWCHNMLAQLIWCPYSLEYHYFQSRDFSNFYLFISIIICFLFNYFYIFLRDYCDLSFRSIRPGILYLYCVIIRWLDDEMARGEGGEGNFKSQKFVMVVHFTI